MSFEQNKREQLNPTVNKPATWQLDIKYFREAFSALERVKFDLEDGIILRLQVERQKELEGHIVRNCYEQKSYTFMQAQKCEEFHYKNDFKLQMLKNYFSDHIPKHLNDYEKCWKTTEFQQLKTVEDKDRAFMSCHEKWLRNLK